MKNSVAFYAAAFLAVACLTSCIKDDGILYHNLTEFGVVRNATSILSDEGVILNVTSKECKENLDTMHRVLYVCDVMRGESQTTFEIILKEIRSVKEQKTVLYTSPEARARQYDDPVYIGSAWFGGGYMNLAVSYYVKTGSATPHTLLLVEEPPVYDEDQAKQVDVNLRLYHEGGGESFANAELNLGELEQVNTYLSIPVNQMDPFHDGKPDDGAFIRLARRWHLNDVDVIDRETKMFYSYGTYSE